MKKIPAKIRALSLTGVAATVACVAISVANAQGRKDVKPVVVTSSPTLNFYGVPGLIDLPSAEALPDGQFTIGVSNFAGQTRTNFTFQFSPRISASFRYIGIQDWDSNGFNTYRDRNFDLRFHLLKENDYVPAVTVGLQDLAGTGIYASEYIVATKNFDRPFSLPGKLKVSAGLGWGRLGSLGDIGCPFGCNRDRFDPDDTGGELSTSSWFRGPASPFAGVEWQATDRLGFKAEYSTDNYSAETSRGVFDRKSRLNFGAEYQVSKRFRIGGYYLYGSEFGVNAQLQLNPTQPPTPFTVAGPRPIIDRPSRAADPTAYDPSWAASKDAPMILLDAMAPDLEEDGVRLESISVSANRAEVRVSSISFDNQAIVVGRTARTMARRLPASVDTFDIVLVNNGLSMSKVTVARRDLETLEFLPDASEALLARSTIVDASPSAPAGAAVSPTIYPRFSWSFGPYVRPSYFDPDQPVRAEMGASLEGRYRFAPGWMVGGDLRYRLVGNIEDSKRVSDSDLPRVRTDAILYARQGDGVTVENLYVSRQWKPSADTFARVTAGYLEQMYGGVSAEVLWKPTASNLALGIEANYARKRDFDQLSGFQDYDVATGHASAYYDFGRGYYGQVDAGRYLAGDYGATFTVARTFANGWRVGGFFTLTDVSSSEFGEGSFDKGINLTIPASWFLGRPSRRTISTTLRPLQRDGGARLSVPGRLYGQIRDGQQTDLLADWGRVWE